MVACLWLWQKAPVLAEVGDRSDVVVWAVRSAAVAAGALAQTVLLVVVVGNLYRARVPDRVLQVVTASLFAASLISAIALGLAGR
jgi:putative Ca2+/H+ antiporter (TMEM165/GDT1 family)